MIDRRWIAACLLSGALLFALPTPAPAQDPPRAAELAKQAMDRLIRGDFKEGLALAEEALRLDPECAAAYGARGYQRTIAGRYTLAAADLRRAYEGEPGNIYWPWQLVKAYMSLDQWQAALDVAEDAYGKKQQPAMLSLRGLARINLGDVDAGLADMDQAIKQRNEAALINRFDGYLFKADWPSLFEEGTRFLATRQPGAHAFFYQIRAMLERGRIDEAQRLADEAERLYGRYVEARLGRALVLGAPAAGPKYDPVRALAVARSAVGAQNQAIVPNTIARILFLAERHHDAIAELETRGRLSSFETRFLLGASHFRLGDTRAARTHLLEARRINPYVSRHAAAVPGLEAFLSRLDREVEAEGKSADRRALVEERTTSLGTLSEIETLVMRFQFERALGEFERYLGTLQSSLRKAETARRIDEVRGLATLFARLREGLNQGRIKDLALEVEGMKVTLTKALDAEWFEFAIPRGQGKGMWPGLGVETMLDFLERMNPTPEERFALGVLAWDFGLHKRAFETVEKATAADRKLLERRNGFVAHRRGLAIPEGGFESWKGAWVTPEEKENLAKGLVSWEGEWVTPGDREKLARGLLKVGTEWVPREEAELLRRGFKKFKDRWYTRSEYDALRSNWEVGWETETDHYRIKTNESEELARELGLLVEETYAECRRMHGGKEPSLPSGQKMTLYAFANFEDYRRYCVEQKAEDQLQASGFARSNSNVVAGWNKTGNTQQFLQTMSHEAAHLFYYRVAPSARPPSWYAEGLATQLEGFGWDGARYVFDRVSLSRLPFLKQAARAAELFTIDQLLTGDALQLIKQDTERALTFYAQCWALVYWLTEAAPAEAAEAFGRYRESVDGGSARDFKGFFKDPTRMEADYLKFVKGL